MVIFKAQPIKRRHVFMYWQSRFKTCKISCLIKKKKIYNFDLKKTCFFALIRTSMNLAFSPLARACAMRVLFYLNIRKSIDFERLPLTRREWGEALIHRGFEETFFANSTGVWREGQIWNSTVFWREHFFFLKFLKHKPYDFN